MLWLFVIVAFLVVFPLIWSLVVLLLAHVGGWARLAKHYGAGNRTVTGTAHAISSLRVGIVTYRFIVTMHVSDDGFFLEVPWMFQLGQPRLFIPWHSISSRQRHWLGGEVLHVGSPEVARITMPKGVALTFPGSSHP